MATSGAFLDSTGLAHFWSSVKSRFSKEDALVEVINSGPKNRANPLAAEGYNSQTSFPINFGGVKASYDSSTGAIVTSGTAGNSTTTMRIPITLTVGKSYRLSGCPANGSSTSYRLDIRTAGTNTVIVSDYGDETPDDPPIFTAVQANYDLCIRYYKTTSAAQTFYPMVCLSEWHTLTGTFVQYRPSWDEMWAIIQSNQ